MALSCIILEIKRDIGQKSWFFHTPALHSTPLLGGSQSDYCLPVWCGKTRMMDLPDGKKSLTTCLAVLTECTNVTDRQTHTHTQTDTADGKGRAWCKHCAAKIGRARLENPFRHPSQWCANCVPVSDLWLRRSTQNFVSHLTVVQEAQLSQRNRAMFRIIEYFAKSLKLAQGHSKWYPWVGRV